MTRNQYIKENGYMAWLGRVAINNELKCLLEGFGANLTNKQINRVSEVLERHIKKVNYEI